ncbi:MAG: hypothetical protein M3R43_00140 [Acidobacteriota bacterium]|nr:hypothetical protein [Acidobacteriota bacterium]
MHTVIRSVTRFTLLGVLAGSLPLIAQELPIEGPVATSATVSVESKQPVQLNPAMIKVEVNGHETALTGLARIQPSTAQIAILIDDGLRSSFGIQIDDLKKFVNALPPGAQVVVGYMRNGKVEAPQGFSTDHSAVAASIRIPISVAGISASPYFCLSDFAKRWPSNARGPRFVLMLTNGVDPYNGSTSLLNQDSPYVQAAQEDAQRAGIAVYAIAYTEAGVRGGSASFSGQSYLNQVAEATGGRSFYNLVGNPVSLAPFLSEFRSAIAESYTATFMASANHENAKTLARLKITTSQPQLKLHAPEGVHPGEQ